MDIIEVVIHKIGYLAYSLPSAFLVLLTKESVRVSFLKRSGAYHEKSMYFRPISSIDPFALFCLSLTNVSWGGLIQKNRKDHWLGFLVSSLALLVLMIVIMIYLNLKNPDKASYLYIFCNSIIKQSWLVFLVNFIPFPPFDLSFFYTQRSYMHLVQSISKVFVIVLLLGGWFDVKEYIPNFFN